MNASTDRIATLEPITRALCVEFLQQCAMQTLPVRVTQGLRTIAEQDALYAQGRTTPGKVVTHARGGESPHNYGAAFDICCTQGAPYPEDLGWWEQVGEVGERVGLLWGGRWQPGKRDLPHFERKDWRMLRGVGGSNA